jgi:hypothetical protein
VRQIVLWVKLGQPVVREAVKAMARRAPVTICSRTSALVGLCVPITSSTLCDQAVFVDQAPDVSVFSDAVPVEIDGIG